MTPEGWLYAGFPNRWSPTALLQRKHFTSRALARGLRTAGFTEIHTYFALPSQRCPAYLVSADRRAELDYFLTRLFFPYVGSASPAYRAPATAGPRLGAVDGSSCASSAACRAQPRDGPRGDEVGMIDALLAWLNDGRAEAGNEQPRLTGGIVAGLYRNSSKVTLILFDARGELGAVVKAARRPSAEAALMAEYAALKELTLMAPEAMHGAPLPIALERLEGQLVLVESPVEGEPMTARVLLAGPHE